MERKQVGWKKVLLYGAVILLLLIFQEVLGKVGRGIVELNNPISITDSPWIFIVRGYEDVIT